MYQVLYRKWRPKTFSDVVGQPQVTITLKNEQKSGRIAHAYLFTGSRGTGKTTCAKILAKAVNCLAPVDGDPCGVCEICTGIENGSILDVVEIDAASNNGVENIRNLREEINFTPTNARYRVYIIDEVHMLSIGAFNALLKTLEEPPPHVIFILATTEVHKIPATILSRCQRFDFHRISPAQIAKHLEDICEREGKTIAPDAALFIAQLADGALRDALSLLDQCIKSEDAVTLGAIEETLGIVGNDYIFTLADAVIHKNIAAALDLINTLYQASKNLQQLGEELLKYFRNIMIFQTVSSPQEIVSLSEEQYAKMREQAKSFSIETTFYIMDTLQAALGKMLHEKNKKIELEMCLVKLCSERLDDNTSSLLERLAKIETMVKAGGGFVAAGGALPANNESAPAPEIAQLEEIAAEPNKDALDLSELRENAVLMQEWPDVIQALKAYSHSIATAFHGSTAYISGNFVLIDAPNKLAFELLKKSAQRDKMRVAIQQVTGKVYKLGPYQPAQAPQTKEDPLQSLIKNAQDAGIEVIKE